MTDTSNNPRGDLTSGQVHYLTNAHDLSTSVPALSDITTLTMGAQQVERTQLDETQYQPQRPKVAYDREPVIMAAGVEVDTVQAFEEPPPTNINSLGGSTMSLQRALTEKP